MALRESIYDYVRISLAVFSIYEGLSYKDLILNVIYEGKLVNQAQKTILFLSLFLTAPVTKMNRLFAPAFRAAARSAQKRPVQQRLLTTATKESDGIEPGSFYALWVLPEVGPKLQPQHKSSSFHSPRTRDCATGRSSCSIANASHLALRAVFFRRVLAFSLQPPPPEIAPSWGLTLRHSWPRWRVHRSCFGRVAVWFRGWMHLCDASATDYVGVDLVTQHVGPPT